MIIQAANQGGCRQGMQSPSQPHHMEVKDTSPHLPADMDSPLDRFECPLCQLRLSSGDDLQQHVLMHAGERASFQCPACNKVCHDAAMFGKHLRVHTNEKPFRCGDCGKSFREKCSLTRHARTHSGERPFTCEVCDKSFSDVGSFGRHKKTHLGVSAKVHACPFTACGKSFIDRSSLKRHVKTHTGEKPFQCQVCSKCFTESGSYKRHLRVHTGEKRYKCRACGRAFSERASMVRHERNVCMIPTDQDPDNDLDPSADDPSTEEGNESPLSLTDFFKFLVRKSADSSDRLNNNNNIYSSVDEDDDGDDGDGSDDVMDCSTKSLPSVPQDRDLAPQVAPVSSKLCSPGVDASGDGTSPGGTYTLPSAMNHLRQKAAEVKEQPSDVEMCFECGDMISDDDGDDDDDDKTTNSDCASTASDSKKARRCSACRLETIIYTNGESSPAANKSSPPVNGKCSPAKLLNGIFSVSALTDNKSSPTALANGRFSTSMLSNSKFLTSTALAHGKSSKAVLANGGLSPSTLLDVKLSSAASTNGKSLDVLDDRSPAAAFADSKPSPTALANGKSSHAGLTDNQPLYAFSSEDGTCQTGSRSSYNYHLHTCSYCGKGFADSSKLRRHVKIHLGLRDFKCQTCGKGFIEACSLRRHESVHSDVKPHNCSLCGKGFTDSSGLKKHSIRCNGQVRKVIYARVSTDGEVKATSTKISSDDLGIRVMDGCVKVVNKTAGTAVISNGIDSAVVANRCSLGVEVTDSSRITDSELASVLNIKKEVSSSVQDGVTPLSHENKKEHPTTEEAVICNTQGISQKAHGLHNQNKSDVVKTESQLTSPACSNTFASNTAFNRSAMVYVCRECGKSCDDEPSLQRHFQSHLGSVASGTGSNPEEPASCHICGKMFVSVQFLIKHLKNHNGTSYTPAPVSVASSELAGDVKNVPKIKAAFPSSPPSVSSGTSSVSPAKTAKMVSPFPVHHKSPPVSSLSLLSKNTKAADTTSSTSGEEMHCEVCGKVFADASSLKRHSRLHTERRQPLPCDNCSKVFWDQGSLKRHGLRGCRNVSMATAGGEVETVPGMISVKVEPSVEESFACTQCRKVFQTREEQMAHEKAHRVSPALRCSVCRKSFSDAATLRRHLNVHASERPYVCEVCFKGFADSSSLGKHRARGCYAQSGVTLHPSKLPCADCGKVFSDKSNFDLHVTSHRGVKPYSCSQCGKSFAEACSLKRHTRLHTGQNLCRCLHCGRTFLENSGLKKHLQRQTCQQEKKPVKSFLYPCTVCQKVFTKRYILFRHMKTHLGLRPYACDTCDKTFTESSSLKRHVRQHTGERPYWCVGCSKTFTDAGVLKKHKHRCLYISRDHDRTASLHASFMSSSRWAAKTSIGKASGPPKPHPLHAPKTLLQGEQRPTEIWLRSSDCWHCGRSFPSAQQRHLHARAAHSGLWPFKCRLCWRRFSRHPYLCVHRKQHHKV